MENFTKTVANCRAFLKSGSRDRMVFRNMDQNGSVEYDYSIPSGARVKIRVDKALEGINFDMYPGIRIQSHFELMAVEYCQRVNNLFSVGILIIDEDSREVYYHIESLFTDDNPIEVSFLERIEAEAVRVLGKHSVVLNSLAGGKLPPWEALSKAIEEDEASALWSYSAEEQAVLDAQVECIQQYCLGDYNINAVSELLGCEESSLQYGAVTQSEFQDFLFIWNGFLICASRMTQRCSAEWMAATASFCNRYSSHRRMGVLMLANGYPCYVVKTFIASGPNSISNDTLNTVLGLTHCMLYQISNLLMNLCLGVSIDDKELYYICRGLSPSLGTQADE